MLPRGPARGSGQRETGGDVGTGDTGASYDGYTGAAIHYSPARPSTVSVVVVKCLRLKCGYRSVCVNRYE